MDRRQDGKKIQAVFFQYNNGSNPVREWLMNDLSESDRKKVGGAIGAVEFEWPVGPPLVKKLDKLWEVRAGEVEKGWARVLFIVEDGEMFLLHGVAKKGKKILKSDLDVALSRLAMLKDETRKQKVKG